jgi:beta-catenin-like protein 1
VKMLDRKNESIKDIARTLQIYHDHVDEEEMSSDADDPERPPTQKEVLQGLISFLEHC